jgi:hypothetical protein
MDPADQRNLELLICGIPATREQMLTVANRVLTTTECLILSPMIE